jgi:hypothetical protein
VTSPLAVWAGLTPTQQRLALYGAIVGGGYLARSRIAVGVGLAGLIGAAAELLTDHALTAEPARMNEFFQTEGASSALPTSRTRRRLLP